LGFKETTQLPGYLKGINVGLIPYAKCKRIDAVFPLKLFEYLAAGKPVVARKTDELNHYSKLISLVETPQEFLEAINLSLHEDSPKKVAARVAAARENTWDARVKDISNIIENDLSPNHNTTIYQ